MLTVTTAATDLNLLTAAETRAAIGGSGTDAQIETLRKRVAAVITRTCKVAADGATPPTLRLETLSETLRPRSRHELLILARRPIVSVTSVTEDDTALAAADYEIEKGSGMLRRLSDDAPSSWAAAKIVVVYRAGWETVPDDLREAASKLAAVLWSEGERVDPNLRRDVVPGVAEKEYWVSPSDDPLMPAEIKELLHPYMNIRIC